MEYKETRQDSTLEEIFKMWDRSETGFIEVADWIAVQKSGGKDLSEIEAAN